MEKIVSFSGGRSSGYMVNMLKDEKPIFIFCNTSKETPETYEFINECDKYFNMNLVVLEYMPKSFRITTIKDCKKNGEVFEELIKYKKMIPITTKRFCTSDMKISVVKRYLKSKGIKQYINYLGIRADEPQRYSKTIKFILKYLLHSSINSYVSGVSLLVLQKIYKGFSFLTMLTIYAELLKPLKLTIFFIFLFLCYLMFN